MKKFLMFTLLFVVTMAVAVGLFLDTLAGRVLETLGGRSLGAPVEVGFVHLSLINGESSIHNLTIKNPPGYPAGVALSVKKIDFKLSILSLLSPVIDVHNIEMDDARIYYIKGPNGSNLGAMGHPARERAIPPVQQANPKKIRIEKVTLRDVQISGDTAAGHLNVTIPFVEVTHIGTPSGTTPDAAIKTILAATLKALPSQFPVYSAADEIKGFFHKWEFKHL